jgi:hypothetical protein
MHLARLIDKIRLRHTGLLQEYNYLTEGFDKYLLDFLQVDGVELEKRVLKGGTDNEILAWVRSKAKFLKEADLEQWNEQLSTAAPKDEVVQARYDARLKDIAAKRGVPVASLPRVKTWVDQIDLDEGRL